MDSSTPENTPEQELQDIPNDTISANEEKGNETPITYYSLSPVDDADQDGHYSTMLLWALQNCEEKDIKNIAITGPYGSGKSSILKTFEKRHKSDELVFLNISLAAFKEEKGEAASHLKVRKTTGQKKEEQTQTKPNSSDVEEKQAMLRLVEMSILQQIFYHEKDEDIPDSRFKKTRSFSEKTAEELSWHVFNFVLALLYLFYSKEAWALIKTPPIHCVDILFNVIAVIAVLCYGLMFIRKSIRPLGNIQFKKINLKDAEFAMDENISKSILNEHLDEILYFFEATKYTVVVFEDLDRFEQTEIFTKLR